MTEKTMFEKLRELRTLTDEKASAEAVASKRRAAIADEARDVVIHDLRSRIANHLKAGTEQKVQIRGTTKIDVILYGGYLHKQMHSPFAKASFELRVTDGAPVVVLNGQEYRPDDGALLLALDAEFTKSATSGEAISPATVSIE
jgi:hypothetical protein